MLYTGVIYITQFEQILTFIWFVLLLGGGKNEKERCKHVQIKLSGDVSIGDP